MQCTHWPAFKSEITRSKSLEIMKIHQNPPGLRVFRGLLIFVLVCCTFTGISAQVWTGYSAEAGDAISIGNDADFSTVVTSLNVPAVASTDTVLLMVNMNVRNAAVGQKVAFTLHRNGANILGGTKQMVEIVASATTEFQSASFSIMDKPTSNNGADILYTVRARYQGMVSADSQVRQLGALVIPAAFPASSYTITNTQDIQTTGYNNIGLETAVTTTATNNFIFVTATMSLLPDSDSSKANIALYRNNALLASRDLQIVYFEGTGRSRMATFFFLDRSASVGSNTYSARVGKRDSGDPGFKVCNGDSVAHINAVAVSSANSISAYAYDELNVDATVWTPVNLAATITPLTGSDRVLVSVNINYRANQASNRAAFTIFRNDINLGQDAHGLQVFKVGEDEGVSAVLSILDSPSTASPVTYTVKVRTFDGPGNEFRLSNNNQLRQISLICTNSLTVAPTPLPTATPTIAPSAVPTFQVDTCTASCVWATTISMTLGNLYKRVILPRSFVFSFSMTLPNAVGGNIVDIRDLAAGTSLLALNRVSGTQGQWSYNGVTFGPPMTFVSGALAVGSATRHIFTISVVGTKILVFTGYGNVNSDYDVTSVDTAGKTYGLFFSNSVSTAAGDVKDISFTGATAIPSSPPVTSPTARPTALPSTLTPSASPTASPTAKPTTAPSTYSPTLLPTANPTVNPTTNPTVTPTVKPTCLPTCVPSANPTAAPTVVPTANPTFNPTLNPTNLPTAKPTAQPSALPTFNPTASPSVLPTANPSVNPTMNPTRLPSTKPTATPIAQPTVNPTAIPTAIPTENPTATPSIKPSLNPTAAPSTAGPTAAPSAGPTVTPTASPSAAPTALPSATPTVAPSAVPSANPSVVPTAEPTDASGEPTVTPTAKPTAQPSKVPTVGPTADPSAPPSLGPSAAPTVGPSIAPTAGPSATPTASPSTVPTAAPSEVPSAPPSAFPSVEPTVGPSAVPSAAPSASPTAVPSIDPTTAPSAAPSAAPSVPPSAVLTESPTAVPSEVPTEAPSVVPTASPSAAPSVDPTAVPSDAPSVDLTVAPTVTPSEPPSAAPSAEATVRPTFEPTTAPIADATSAPCCVVPTGGPSEVPSAAPSEPPTAGPSAQPTMPPSAVPSAIPSAVPSAASSAVPTAAPSARPSANPSAIPSVNPTVAPSVIATPKPTAGPTVKATDAAGIVIPDVPQLASAVFSNDGTHVVVTFTSATNKANLMGKFACSLVLSFTGASTASCVWTSATVITAYPSSSSLLSVGASVAVISNSGVKAACPTSVLYTVCTSWAQTSAISILLQAPASPAAPVVSLAMTSVLSGCSPLSMDLSTSTGSGGRAWLPPVFTVASTQGDGSAVAAFLNKNYTFSGAFAVPSALFPVNGLYTVSVTLSNFLGASATASQSVTVTKSSDVYPTVSIPGQEKRTVSANVALLLTPSVYTVDCSGAKTTGNLVYLWTVFVDGKVQPALVSQSLDPSKFRLPAYSLTPLTTYGVMVSVTNVLSSRTSTATVTVTVQQGALVAQISGGSTQSVLVDGSLTLDASSSYDQDIATRTGTAAGLSFSWTCTQTAPMISDVCPLTMGGTSLQTLVLSASSTAASTTSSVTVTVSDGNTRTRSVSVQVTAQDSSAPQVAITSSAQSVTSVNVNSRLALAASVTVQSSCTAQWSVDDSSVVLLNRALTPVSTVIPVGTTRALNLVVAAAGLPERSTLVFTLACGTSSAAITVTTNGPPLPGVFAVTPASGVELTTNFAFSASFWSDNDLPISYQFGFVSSTTGATLTLRSRSESSSASNTLAAGPASVQYAVTCTVVVFDVLNAATTASTVVTVTQQTDSTALQASLVAQLSASSGSNDGTKSVLSIASAVINAVSCSSAPVCASLNRAACAKVQNTCGACLDAYLGDSGDHNSPCVSATSAETPEKTVDSSCTTDAACGGWLACDTTLAAPVCYLPAKRCPDDCSGQGTCVARNANSMKQVTSCYAGDSTCVVSCTCAATYSGANCATTDAELEQKQALRSQFLQSLSDVASTDDVDSASVAALSSSLSSLTQNSYELSAASVDLISSVANTVLTNAASLGDFSYDDAVGVLSAIDAAAAATVRLNSTNTVSFANKMMETIALFNSLVSSQLVAGQEGVEYVQDSFRLSSIRQLRGFNTSLKIVSPLTILEAFNGGRTSSVSIDAAVSGSRLLSTDVEGDEEEFAVNMVETSASTYGELGASFNSNPVQVMVSRTSTAPTRVTFVLAHNEAADFTSREEAHEMGFNSTCTGLTDTSLYYFTCPLSGEVLTHNCTGLAGTLTSYCPVRAPTCAIVNGTAGAVVTNSSDCEVLSFDLYSTTCSCLIQPSVEATVRSRRLSLSDLQQTGLLDAVSVTVYMGSEFKNTFNSAKDLNSAADLKRVLIVIVMFCTLWAGGLLLIFSCTWRRNLKKKINAKAETHLEKKVAVAEVSRSPAAVHQYLTDYVIQTFPSVFSNKPFFSRLYGEIKRHHRYLTLFTAPEGETGDKQRILTGVQLLTIQTMLMFLLAMLYDVQSPSDDGSCPGWTNPEDCTARKSVFDSTVSYCDWRQTDDTSFVCEYRDSVFSLKVTLYISVIVALLTAIISYPTDYIFELLSAPVADEAKAAAQDTVIKQVGRRASNVARRASNAALTVAAAAKNRVARNSYVVGTVTRKLPGSTEAAHALATASMTVIAENSRRTIMNRQMTRMRSYQASGGKYGATSLSADDLSSSDSDSDNSSNSDDDSDNNLGPEDGAEVRPSEIASSRRNRNSSRNNSNTGDASNTQRPAEDQAASTLLSKLSEEVHCQRRLLKPSEVEEFDTQWGLDPTGEFTQGERSVVPCVAGRPGAEQIILSELKYVKKESNQKAEKLRIATDAHTGLEILHLFIMDLLGRGTPAAIIFETKSEEDFQHIRVVTRNTKRLAALALFGINAFFVYYSILTGFRKGVHWQQIFLMACIAQFIVEVVLFETMEVVWINCAIPVLVSDEVRAVGESIIEVVQHLCSETPAESRLFLNAPDYLFISTNVAKEFPHLMESVLVQAYNSHIPGELARKWQTGSIARMHRRHRRRNVSVFGMFFRALQYIGTAPFFLHRMVIRFIQPFVLTGLALLWQIIVSNVIYIAVAVFVLLVILAYGLYRRFQEKKVLQKAQNVTPVIAEYLSSKGEAEFDHSDEDLHMPNVLALTNHEQDTGDLHSELHSEHHSASQSRHSSESKDDVDSDASDSDGFAAHPRGGGNGSVSSALRRPSLSDSELSSADLSTSAHNTNSAHNTATKRLPKRVMRLNRAMSYMSDRSVSDESASSSGNDERL